MGAGGRVLVGVCLLLTATVASGAPGSLDPTFGSGGWVTNPGDVAVGVAIQPDDRIIVVGQSALYRYEPDGAADGTFGAGGQAALVHGSGFLALQPADGKIVVTGFAGDVVTTRYATDGSVDTTFGTLGTVTTAPTAGLDYPTAIAVQPDGKILVVGAANSTFIFLARYDSGGTPDPTFGTGGLVITDLGASVQRVNAVRVQPDGKLVIAGPINVTSLDFDELVARYDASGVLDHGFGVGGVVQLDLGTHEDLPNDLLVQPDGTITLPLLGQVRATRRTVQSLRDEIEELYKKYYRVPAITVTPRSPRPKMSAMSGVIATRGTERSTIATGMNVCSTERRRLNAIAHTSAAAVPAARPTNASRNVVIDAW
jgi:uncharacterized delta-60 repeat protein